MSVHTQWLQHGIDSNFLCGGTHWESGQQRNGISLVYRLHCGQAICHLKTQQHHILQILNDAARLRFNVTASYLDIHFTLEKSTHLWHIVFFNLLLQYVCWFLFIGLICLQVAPCLLGTVISTWRRRHQTCSLIYFLRYQSSGNML